jgi:hypothetical protein
MPFFSLKINCAILSCLGLSCVYGNTLDVRTFGATGDGTSDDTAAIRQAVSSSVPGDTIWFPAGSYRLSGPIWIQSNRTYSGDAGAKLLGQGGKYMFATPYNSTNNLTITGLVFDGGPIAIQGDGNWPATNVQITKCTFQNITDVGPDWTTHQGIFIAALTNSSITNNTFRNILPGGRADSPAGYGNGIWANNVSNTTIGNNVFDTVSEGMYLMSDYKSSHPGIVISNNTGTSIHRMGIEMQVGLSTVQISGNNFSNFLNPYWDTFGISFASPGSTAVIQNNTLIASPAATTFGRYGYAIEAAGKGTQVLNNSIQGGWSAGVAIGGSQDLSVASNNLCGSPNAIVIFDETGAAVINAIVGQNALSLVCN